MTGADTKFEDRVVISGIGQSAIGRRLGRSPLALTLDAITAALEDAGLSPGDIGGLTTYPGGGSALGPGFAGPPLADVYDALGLEVDAMLGNFEGPAQLGPILTGCLAINAGLVRHVVAYRTVTEGSARQRASEGREPAAPVDWTRQWITPFGGGPGTAGLRAARPPPLPRVRHDARAAGPDRADRRAATRSATPTRSTATRSRWPTTSRRA